MSNVIKLNDGNFDEAVKNNKLLVVDIWAEWCGPCKMLGPVIEDVAKELAGKVVFAKMNTEEAQAVPSKFGVSSIPTLLIFKDGKYIDRLVGFIPKSAIIQKLSSHL